MLTWDPIDVLSCLGVQPEISADEVSYSYSVSNNGLRLLLTIFPLSGHVALTICCDGQDVPVVDLELRDCNAVRLVADSRGEWLEFGVGQLFVGRYDGTSPIPQGLQLLVQPSIGVRFFRREC